jgi:hypothetical protein
MPQGNQLRPERDQFGPFVVCMVIRMEVVVLILLVLAALAVAWFSIVSVYRVFRGEV